MKFLLLAALLGYASANLKCPPGKVLNPCGDLCQVTCKDVTIHNVPKVCPDVCLPPACVCPEGQALIRGQCVAYGHCWRLPPEEDPASKRLECPAGKVLDPCGDLCEVTCHDVITNNIPKQCPKICLEPKCVCPNGTALYHRSRTCVPYGNCWRLPHDTPHADTQRIWLENQQKVVKTSNGQSSSSSSSESREESNDQSKIHQQQKNTPLKFCGPNEQISLCGRRCEKSCQNLYELMPFCYKSPCIPGVCTCNEDFVRNEQGTCVQFTECPNWKNHTKLAVLKVKDPNINQEEVMQCGENEFLNECGNSCEKTCLNALLPGPCPFVCSGPACQCKSGYVRSDDGQCMEEINCYDHNV